GQELDEGAEVTADELRALGQNLNARLQTTADMVEKLTKSGWEVQMALYDLIMSHPYVTTETEARSRLDELGIDPDLVHIEEFDEEACPPPRGAGFRSCLMPAGSESCPTVGKSAAKTGLRAKFDLDLGGSCERLALFSPGRPACGPSPRTALPDPFFTL